MAKPELGTKRICPTTGKKFYDLNQDPVVSPYTGQAFPRSAFEPLVKGAALAGAAAVAARAPVAREEDEPEAAAANVELVSLEDVEAGEAEKDVAVDEPDLAEDAAEDDTFLEEEEEGDDDVSDLIDGDIEDDEEA